jgi:coproporphyrinogen III oxidase-like Fe-S oxidoreductase
MDSKVINQLITKIAKQEFARALKFEEGVTPELPSSSDEKLRLLYLHIPFCEELCPYCSFHRVPFEEGLTRKYFAALKREINLYFEKGYKFGGIYVGGGTPTVLVEELAEVLALAREKFAIKEISVETNPNHLIGRNIEILRQSGVNRLSVGVQTFNNDLLKKIGRYERYGAGEDIALKLKQTMGLFDTVNADMIFNFPGQTPQMLSDDLATLLNLKMEQITFYPLMTSTITQRLMEDTVGHVDFGSEKKLFQLIIRRLAADYESSSAWCFSRKNGKEALIDEYVVDYDEYAGLGSGAIGYLNGECFANTFDIGEYISLLTQGKLPLTASRKFNMHDQMSYDFLMKLFSTKMDVTVLEKKYGGKFLKSLWKEMIAFTLAGSFRYFPPYMHLTPWGRYYWVIMMREFFIAVNNFRDYCRGVLPKGAEGSFPIDDIPRIKERI